MKISELFDQPLQRTLRNSSHNYVVTARLPNNSLLEFRASIADVRDNVWSVIFHVDDHMSLTPTPHSSAILSTVIQAAQDFVVDRNPTWIYFTADASEPSRVKFYNRLADRAGAWGYQNFSDQPQHWPLELADYRNSVAEKVYVLGRKGST